MPVRPWRSPRDVFETVVETSWELTKSTVCFDSGLIARIVERDRVRESWAMDWSGGGRREEMSRPSPLWCKVKEEEIGSVVISKWVGWRWGWGWGLGLGWGWGWGWGGRKTRQRLYIAFEREGIRYCASIERCLFGEMISIMDVATLIAKNVCVVWSFKNLVRGAE